MYFGLSALEIQDNTTKAFAESINDRATVNIVGIY
jgi:hypothetical protein